MQKTNYNIIFNKSIEHIKVLGTSPRLLLHACCAPCSSYVLTLLCDVFKVSALFYNPNIYPHEEHDRRMNELMQLITQKHTQIDVITTDYAPERFYDAVKGLEDMPEGGQRCFSCYELRLNFAAEYAKQNGFDYFTTTLSISPHKNSQMLNLLGEQAAQRHGVNYLFSDFKKGGGYGKSVTLAKEYGLYRQDYCGCKYSIRDKHKL